MNLSDKLSTLRSYGTALLAVAVAILITHSLAPVLDGHVSPIYVLAVFVSALHGGRNPALLATLLSSLAAAYFDLSEIHRIDIGVDDFITLESPRVASTAEIVPRCGGRSRQN